MSDGKKFFCFVGVPFGDTMMSMPIEADEENVVAKVNSAFEGMMNAIDGTGTAKFVWATYDAKKTSFEKACSDFGSYMKFCKSKMAHISE